MMTDDTRKERGRGLRKSVTICALAEKWGEKKNCKERVPSQGGKPRGTRRPVTEREKHGVFVAVKVCR